MFPWKKNNFLNRIAKYRKSNIKSVFSFPFSNSDKDLRMAKVFFKLVFVSIIILVSVSSCKQDDLKPGIPAFVQVDTMTFNTVYVDQGTSMQKISDVWVYADDESIGAFEMPSSVPILKSGNGKLRLEAGIKLNGISSTRLPNPFFEPIIIEDFNYVPDSVSFANFGTTYWETVVFVWKEDFEGNNISIDTTSKSNATMVFTEPGSPETFEGDHSGKIVLNSEMDYYEGASYQAFDLPTDGSPVFLEMHYKCNNILVVGIFAQDASQIIQDPVIYINPRDNWNKIYINLTSKLQSYDNALDFKIFFGAIYDSPDEEAVILIDNIKLMYR